MSDENAKHPKTYKIVIDKHNYEVDTPVTTARNLLVLAGKTPPEQYALYLKVAGGQPQRLPLDGKIDLSEPGKEKFVTLPLDQTEGRGNRREFKLPAEDQEWLETNGLPYELVSVGGVLRVVVYDVPVCSGFLTDKVDINVRIDPGYPDAQIDMAYFFPPLQLATGKPIGAICDDPFDGKVWQRWSRHRTGQNPWRPGIDSLETHFSLIEDWLFREVKKAI